VSVIPPSAAELNIEVQHRPPKSKAGRWIDEIEAAGVLLEAADVCITNINAFLPKEHEDKFRRRELYRLIPTPGIRWLQGEEGEQMRKLLHAFNFVLVTRILPPRIVNVESELTHENALAVLLSADSTKLSRYLTLHDPKGNLSFQYDADELNDDAFTGHRHCWMSPKLCNLLAPDKNLPCTRISILPVSSERFTEETSFVKSFKITEPLADIHSNRGNPYHGLEEKIGDVLMLFKSAARLSVPLIFPLQQHDLANVLLTPVLDDTSIGERFGYCWSTVKLKRDFEGSSEV